ncbi:MULTISPECIES: kinase [unclassified Kitasatospora]|uniref:kinase n=1 Tax=unclassified Kitasatospora TaxID=2633591 RepID=UPI0033F510E3
MRDDDWSESGPLAFRTSPRAVVKARLTVRTPRITAARRSGGVSRTPTWCATIAWSGRPLHGMEPIAGYPGSVLVGSDKTRLLVLRGNCASGKSTVAKELRARYGRGIAIVGQDNIRCAILDDHDLLGAPNIGLIDAVARYSLNHGYHVIIEGILYADHYGPMLRDLAGDHRGSSSFFYLDIPFPETVHRHQNRSERAEFGEKEMREWFRPKDLLPDVAEEIIDHTSTLDATVGRLLVAAGLGSHARRP